ncbi:phosphocarrier protein HPr [Virgibacillus sp. W0430]|uniref:phosphocarrier protein HPr n=1 Tax=Virgibacillus sp. W0430 TaxID=3391580 RepID=UPI003F47A1D9
MVEKTFKVITKEGIHARPATVLVKKASEIKSEVSLVYKEKTVNMKSIMGVMALGIPHTASFQIVVEGNDEEEGLEMLTTFLKAEGIAE